MLCDRIWFDTEYWRCSITYYVHNIILARYPYISCQLGKSGVWRRKMCLRRIWKLFKVFFSSFGVKVLFSLRFPSAVQWCFEPPEFITSFQVTITITISLAPPRQLSRNFVQATARVPPLYDWQWNLLEYLLPIISCSSDQFPQFFWQTTDGRLAIP